MATSEENRVEPVNADRTQYSKPTLTRHGTVRNLTGGSCGWDLDGFFGNPSDGNPWNFPNC